MEIELLFPTEYEKERRWGGYNSNINKEIRELTVNYQLSTVEQTRASYPVDSLTLFTLHLISQWITGDPILSAINRGSEYLRQ